MASASSLLNTPNVYGIDMPTEAIRFAADGRTEIEISKLIGADKLFYQNLEDLISAVKDKIHLLKPLIRHVLMEIICYRKCYRRIFK